MIAGWTNLAAARPVEKAGMANFLPQNFGRDLRAVKQNPGAKLTS